jgi:hypothetical protein
MLVVLGVVGLCIEIADGRPWVLVAAGAAAAVWILSRSS